MTATPRRAAGQPSSPIAVAIVEGDAGIRESLAAFLSRAFVGSFVENW
jgi:hypothetical protein